MESVGIMSIGLYLPEQRMSSQEIAAASGIPVEVVEQKMGIKEKTIPALDDHPCEMGIRAAKQAIDRAGIQPEEIEVVIYIGEEYKEYPVWTAAIHLQREIGAVNAWAFDIALRCGTSILGMKLAKDLMTADPAIRTVLLAGGYRNGDLVNYQNPRTRFLFNLSAGGGAILLRRGWTQNEVLATHIITDGSFSQDVIIPTGGTKISHTCDGKAGRWGYFDVPDAKGMKERLERASLQNFLEAIRQSLQKSGLSDKDIDYLGILHMKRSAHEAILKELGLSSEQTIYLDHYGHMGQFDQILSLELGLQAGKIKESDVVVLVSAGIGYAWGATTIRWGRV
ncbi:3-oxoacyl-ACP synthase [Thermoflavimicrobium dichotomicum]|uniref:3-oxoacyl-[acyl-carrier-protein] synthase-3 n=1 Tax=Thermoflavimicrobium dichotomicum TaxID=46223 RepID=A0A1I3RYJ5_9BACL|nr:3-oxoacyl-ACP synthase [Thermoflavimicrobium dichotomicum]SFJ51704.1 3-oxoacyl-[acyl-carrier-protein] synthase-3 [Thermoflavimicrobium dichotomicum]